MARDVGEWLDALDLAKYKDVFAENEIAFGDLSELTDDDLKEMGLPIGPRRRVLKEQAELAVQDGSLVAPASKPRAKLPQDSP
ncbi:MAG: hypothetical protein HKN05_02535, partial [Rhizobiales bacterium]|nr:hypothetical protein [Hyphomicrobiales bacterium]